MKRAVRAVRAKAPAATDAEMRALMLRMQAVIVARRAVWQVYPPTMAAVLDMRLRLIGARLIAEMRRVEGRESA